MHPNHEVPIGEPKKLDYQQYYLSTQGVMPPSDEEEKKIVLGELAEPAIMHVLEFNRDSAGFIAKVRLIVEHIGFVKLNDPKLVWHIRCFLQYIGKDRKPATVARYRAAISKMFSIGMQMGLINFNPVKLIPKPKESAPRNRFLNEIEIAAFIRACLADENRSHALMLLLCLYTGLRSGNVRSIQLGWLFDDDTRLEIPMTKSGKPHTAYLSKEAQQVVKEARQYARNGYLFPATRGDGYMSKPTKLFKRVLARMEEEGALTAPFVIHDLRRSMASHLLKATSDIRLVQQMLGHADVRTTERYAYHADDTLKNASQVAADAMLSVHKSH
ncbi:Tyrosine recombinase XerC [Pseudoalteromonas sp. P1-9]|uniref:tyrosine-type recombinase/integrase n=1 Tax=Pseudoalteromonas sp. P1-9 TaxID=1710354 RepID=UPI0006D60986|nr:site-specific integrase [Pseudoalteromonas sp. P1-9]KPV96767.1 Tyrosine recombinase XerC [Pseudoalteromonas sp. P1-9]